MKRERDNPGDHIPNSDQNSAEHLRSQDDVDFETEMATYVSLAQAQDPIIEPMEIADLVPPIKDELPTSPHQASGFGDLKSPEAIQGERAKRLYEQFDRELADALMESKKGLQNINQEPSVTDKSDVGNKGKGRAEKLSIDLSLIETQSTYGSQPSLFENLLAQDRYNPNIHGSSSRDLLGSLPYSHLAPSELELTADEKELIDNGILSYDEILQQRIQMSQFEGQGIFQSQPQSQGLFSEKTNPFAQNSGEGESMAKSGPARGIDHKFIESQGGLGSSSEGFSADSGSSSLGKEQQSVRRKLMEQIYQQAEEAMMSSSVEILEEIGKSLDHLEDSPPPLIGCEDDIQSLVFNETEMEFLRDGMTIEQIIEQRQIANQLISQSGENAHELSDLNDTEMELFRAGIDIQEIIEQRQIAERIQPLSAESLNSNSSQKSPSRE